MQNLKVGGTSLSFLSFSLYFFLSSTAQPNLLSPGHVLVALRMRAAGKALRAGDFVEYVVCVSNDSNLADRCYHPSEVRKAEGQLVIDKDWYIKHQILPPVARLCGPMKGIDQQQLAQRLGLDFTKYQVHSGNERPPFKT